MTNPRGNTTIDGQTAELILERPFRDPQGTILHDLTNYGSASIFSAAALRSNVGTPANQWVPYQGDNNVQVTMRSVAIFFLISPDNQSLFTFSLMSSSKAGHLLVPCYIRLLNVGQMAPIFMSNEGTNHLD